MNKRNVWGISSSVAEKAKHTANVRPAAVRCLFSSLVHMEKNPK